MNEKQQRNELCACGSQKKYKKCCGLKAASQKQKSRQFFNPAQGVSAVKSLSQHMVKVVDGVKMPTRAFSMKPQEEKNKEANESLC